jgi:hypothetical protein
MGDEMEENHWWGGPDLIGEKVKPHSQDAPVRSLDRTFQYSSPLASKVHTSDKSLGNSFRKKTK